jgi:hypothetical protein
MLSARERTRTFNQNGIERRVFCRWALLGVEILQICHVRELTQVTRDPNRVLFRRSWRIRVCVVELKEAGDRDILGTGNVKVRICKYGRRVGATRVSRGVRTNRDVDSRKYNANVERMEGGAHRLRAAKVRRGLYELDVRVQVLRETILCCAYKHIAVDSVLPHMKFLDVTSKSQCQNRDRTD